MGFGFTKKASFGISVAGMACMAALTAKAQTTPSAIPVPFASAAMGNGFNTTVSSACTTAILDTDGTSVGDGCRYDTVPLNSPQGASVDKYGNVYFADYSHKLVRVLYEGGTQLAAAIVAANSNFTPSSHALTSFTPTVGNVYSIAGTGATTLALTVNSSGTYSCANNSASATAGFNSLGDGCPGAGATVGPRAVVPDSDGNLFITDYTNSRVRVLCVNCAAGTMAATMISSLDGVTPVNGDIYTVVGFTIGYRDQAPGYAAGNPGSVVLASATSVSSALLRSPTTSALSANDDVFIADNLNNALRVLFNGGTAAKNILTAEGYTPVVGSVYTIAGAGCVSAAVGKQGNSASANSCLTTAGSDTAALGTTPGSSATAATGGVGTGPVWAVAVDPSGNVYYTDETNARVKVLYGGIAAPLTFAGKTLNAGYTYSFAGQGSAAAGTVNGVPPSQLAFTAATGAEGVGTDANGNVFMMDYGNGLVYETYAQTGIAAIIVGGAAQATLAKGGYCNGGNTGPTSFDAVYNGCPGTQVKLSNPRGPIVADASGTLYFGDSVGSFIRRFSYSPTFPATAVGTTSPLQSYAFTFLSAQTLAVPSFPSGGAASSEFADAGGDTCASGTAVTPGVAGRTCVFYATFTPAKPGLRAGALLLNSATAVLGETLFGGMGNGAGLTIDPGTQTTMGAGLKPNGVAVDGAGRVLVADATSKSVLRYTGSVATTVASGFTSPAGVAVDGAGNVFVADSSANTVSEIPVVGGTKFTVASALNKPNGLAADGLGDVFVADTGNNRVLMYGPGASVPMVLGFSSLNAPQAVAVDANGSVYAADSTQILKLTSAGVQSIVGSGNSYTGLAVDAGGNVLASTATDVLEYPASGSTAVTLSSGFSAVKSLALDGSGNAFLADSGAAGYTELQRTAGSYKFTSSPSSTTLILTASGNIALTAPVYTQSDSTDFSLAGATTNGCSGAIALGTECGLSATYSPTVSGTLTDSVAVSSNAANASPITITLTGTTSAQNTTTTLSAMPAMLVYGNVETLTATVSGSLQAPSNGTVNFYNNGSLMAFASANVVNGQAVYSFVPAVGSYSVTAAYVPNGLTYAPSATASASSFSVTPATLTVTANNASKVSGTANPALTYSITGFVNNDSQSSAVTGTPMEATTATTTSAVGAYPITITQGSLAAANYNFTFVNGTLTVSGSTAQTITFSALPNVTYGVAPITLTATASSGLAVSYTVTGPATVSGSTLTVTGAGMVSVTVNQTGNNTYAAATSVTQSFTVAKAMLTATATSVSRLYGATNPTLTYTLAGFVNSDTQATATTGAPAETTIATASSAVGGYPITITSGTLAAPNYTFGFANGTLTVTPAALTLTANSAMRAYGAANPTFTGTISGTVNNDALTETFSTAATGSSNAGTYAIVPAVTGTNAGNYTVNATNGTLTVTQVKPGITLVGSPATGYNGSTTITLTATMTANFGTPTGTVTFILAGGSIGMATLSNGVAALQLTTLPAGVDSITAMYSGDTNFTTVTSTAASVTIAAGFGATASSTSLSFPANYQEAQTFLTINPGGRTDTISFSCSGLPSKLSCAFTPPTLSLSGVTAQQMVQMLVSNSGASASLRDEPGLLRGAGRGFSLASLPLGGLLLLGFRRRRGWPMRMLAVLLSLGAVLGVSGCGSSPTAVQQNSGTYNFNVSITSGSATLQSIPLTITVP